MALYRVTNNTTGQEVHKGDTLTNFRGETGTFQMVTRGTEYNGTAKILVDGSESYERVWNVTVETVTT